MCAYFDVATGITSFLLQIVSLKAGIFWKIIIWEGPFTGFFVTIYNNIRNQMKDHRTLE